MIDQVALKMLGPKWLSQRTANLLIKKFGQDDFVTPFSEQEIVICHGRKSEFESAVHFWVVSESLKQDWSGREMRREPFILNASCETVDRKKFDDIALASLRDLKSPVPTVGEVSSAAFMYDQWNLKILLAELPEEFLSFEWNTSA